MSVYAGPEISQSGLVLHLDAANAKSYPGSGNTWIDLSRSNNNGILTNGPVFNNTKNGTIVFDGIDDKVDCGNNISVNNLTALSGVVWFNKTADASFAPRLLTKRSAIQDSGWWDFLSVASTHNISFNADFVTTDILRQSSDTIALNQWAMAAFTWTGSSSATDIKLYINGKEVLYSASTDGVGGRVPETTNRLVIGNADWANRPFVGNMAMASLYNRVLTAAEIKQNFNAMRGRFGI